MNVNFLNNFSLFQIQNLKTSQETKPQNAENPFNKSNLSQLSFCANTKGTDLIPDNVLCERMLKNAKINGKKRFSSDEVQKLNKEIKNFKTTAKKSLILKDLLQIKNGNAVLSFDDIANFLYVTSGANKDAQMGTIRILRSEITEDPRYLPELDDNYFSPIENNPQNLEIIKIMERKVTGSDKEKGFAMNNAFCVLQDSDKPYFTQIAPLVAEKMKIKNSFETVDNMVTFLDERSVKKLLPKLNEQNIRLVKEVFENGQYSKGELKERLNMILDNEKSTFNRSNFDLSLKYPNKKAPTFAVIDIFSEPTVHLLNEDYCSHGQLISAVINASSPSANIDRFDINSIYEDTMINFDYNDAKSYFDKTSKELSKRIKHKTPRIRRFIKDGDFWGGTLAFLKVLDNIDNGRHYDGVNLSFGEEHTFDELSKKFVIPNLNATNIHEHKKEILDTLMDSDNENDLQNYVLIQLINEVVKKGVPVYISSGNGAGESFNMLNLGNSKTVGALAMDGKRATYSTNNSAITGWGQANYPLTKTDGGYSLLGDDIIDITPEELEDPSARYIYNEYNEKRLTGGTSSASPRKMVEDYYKKRSVKK